MHGRGPCWVRGAMGVRCGCAVCEWRHATCVWCGRELLSLVRRGDVARTSEFRCACDAYMQNMVVSSGRATFFRAGGCAPLPPCLWALRALARRRFRQPTPLNSCFQLGYSLLKFTKDLLNTCLQLAYSLLPACFQPAYSLLPASLPSAYICYRSSFNPY